MPIVLRSSGSFKHVKTLLGRDNDRKILDILSRYAQKGVEALSDATPINSGRTSYSWSYEISVKNGSANISWTNDNVNKGQNIAILLQLGHGTGTGGWVEGRDYINPALQPIFDKIASDLWKEVTAV